MYLVTSHFFDFKVNIGNININLPEFIYLKILLKVALELGLSHLKIFGDYTLVISWMNDKGNIQNINHLPLAMNLK